jgi:hypothetical protein
MEVEARIVYVSPMIKRLEPDEIEVIAREVIASVFSGTRTASAPVTLDFDFPEMEPEHVSVEVHLPNRLDGEVDPERTAQAMVELNQKASALGDDRFFGIMHRYGRLGAIAA